MHLRSVPFLPPAEKKPGVAEVTTGASYALVQRYVPHFAGSAVLRRAVQWFAVIVPFNAVLCRAEKARKTKTQNKNDFISDARFVPESCMCINCGKLCTCTALYEQRLIT